MSGSAAWLHPRQQGRQSIVVRCGQKLRVVIVSTEVTSWSKTGGLADVAAALPSALAARGHTVMTVSPMYSQYSDVYDTGLSAPVRLPTKLLKQQQNTFQDQPHLKPGTKHDPAAAEMDRRRHKQKERVRGLQKIEIKSRSSALTLGSKRRKVKETSGIHVNNVNSKKRIPAEPPEPSLVREKPTPPQSHQADDSNSSVVRFYASRRDDVDHLFVSHPLFLHGASGGPHGMTYSDGANQQLDAQARGSLLCQAALAAPVLFWMSDNVKGLEKLKTEKPYAVWAIQNGISRPAGSHHGRGSAFSSSLARLLNSATSRPGTSHVLPQLSAFGPGRPIIQRGQDQEQAHEQGQKEAHEQDQEQAHQQGQGPHLDPSVIFVANDWPTGLMPLWFDAYLDEQESQATTGLCNNYLDEEDGQALTGPCNSYRTITPDLCNLPSEAGLKGLPSKDEPKDSLGSLGLSLKLTATHSEQLSSGSIQTSNQGQPEPLHASLNNQGKGYGPGLPISDRTSEVVVEAEMAKGQGLLVTHSAIPSLGEGGGYDGSDELHQVPLLTISSSKTKTNKIRGRTTNKNSTGITTSANVSPAYGVGQKALSQSLKNFRRLVVSKLSDCRFVTAIHNFGFHGLFSAESFQHLGLPDRHLPLVLTGAPQQFAPGDQQPSSSLQQVSWLQAALLCSDMIITVSQKHAMELQQAAEIVLQEEKGKGMVTQDINENQIQHQLQLFRDSKSGVALGFIAENATPVDQRQCQQHILTKPVPVGGPKPSMAMAISLLADASAIHHKHGAGLGRLKETDKDFNESCASMSKGVSGDSHRPSSESQLRSRVPGVIGILNGIDTKLWSPEHDPYLAKELRYDASSVAEGKAKAKRRLQVLLGLTPNPSVPLFAFIGRLEDQKGTDLILSALPQLLGCPASGQLHNILLQSNPAAAGAAAVIGGSVHIIEKPRQLGREKEGWGTSPELQLAMLGCGQAWQEQALLMLEQAYPGTAVGVPQHNEALAHLLIAGADFVILPSRYEPCGLVALLGVSYGTVPIVSPVGGLVDIVEGEALALRSQGPFPRMGRQDSGTLGYILDCVPGPVSDTEAGRQAVSALVSEIQQATADFGGERFLEMRGRCMNCDVGWAKAVEQWEEVLQSLVQS